MSDPIDQKKYDAPHALTLYAAPLPLSAKLMLIGVGLFFAFFVDELVFVIACCILCIYLYNVIVQKIVHGRAFKVLENHPPDDLRPAEIGMLYDHRQSIWEVVSVYLYLIAHKYIEMEIHNVGGGLRAGEHTLRLTNKDQTSLRQYERDLLEKIFAPNVELTTKDVRDNSIVHARLTHGIKQELQKCGYYFFYGSFTTDTYEQAQRKRLERFFSHWKNIFAIGKGELKYVTPKGRDVWRRIAGFKHHLMIAEKERVRFHTDPNQRQDIYIDAMAPYAVALGIDTEWTNEIFGLEESDKDSQHRGDWSYVMKKYRELQNKK